MTSLMPVEIPATTAGTTMRATPVYGYLMVQPDHWLQQAFFVGRPKLPVARVIEAMQANGQNLEEAAITEALDYYQRFHDVIEADTAKELSLSDDLARERLPVQ